MINLNLKDELGIKHSRNKSQYSNISWEHSKTIISNFKSDLQSTPFPVFANKHKIQIQNENQHQKQNNRNQNQNQNQIQIQNQIHNSNLNQNRNLNTQISDRMQIHEQNSSNYELKAIHNHNHIYNHNQSSYSVNSTSSNIHIKDLFGSYAEFNKIHNRFNIKIKRQRKKIKNMHHIIRTIPKKQKIKNPPLIKSSHPIPENDFKYPSLVIQVLEIQSIII